MGVFNRLHLEMEVIFRPQNCILNGFSFNSMNQQVDFTSGSVVKRRDGTIIIKMLSNQLDFLLYSTQRHFRSI